MNPEEQRDTLREALEKILADGWASHHEEVERGDLQRMVGDHVDLARNALAAVSPAPCPQCDGSGTEDRSWDVSEPCAWLRRAEAAEARVRELEDALRPFVGVGRPAWLSIGALDNVAEVRVTRKEFEAARAALASSPSREETPGENTP